MIPPDFSPTGGDRRLPISSSRVVFRYWTFESGWRVGRFRVRRHSALIQQEHILSATLRAFRCAEINSSFHRPHATATYVKWRDSTPVDFRFAVKMPRTITHELQLQDAREPFVTFLAQTDGLAEKRGPVLVQFAAVAVV